VDISFLLKGPDSNESTSSPPHKHQARATSVPPQTVSSSIPPYATAGGSGGKLIMPSNVAELPAKKQSKWSAEEDALIIDLS